MNDEPILIENNEEGRKTLIALLRSSYANLKWRLAIAEATVPVSPEVVADLKAKRTHLELIAGQIGVSLRREGIQ